MSANPSLRGFMLGYVSEYKLRKLWFMDERISNLIKYDDHDRTKKGDLSFTYRGVLVSVEVKSLQTRSIRRSKSGWTGRFQCDASDKRRVILPSGDQLETTCLLVGEFDLLAVNLWQFAFAKNIDLPRSRFKGYTPEQRQYLLAAGMEITFPLQALFQPEPFRLLDEIVQAKRTGDMPDVQIIE